MPRFYVGEERVARVPITNLVARAFNCSAVLYMGIDSAIMSEISFSLAAKESKVISLPVIMPNVAGTYPVSVGVFSGGKSITPYRSIKAVAVQLYVGSNIIALAAEPTIAYTASTLATHINSQGGSVTEIHRWNAVAGSWDIYLVDINYGTNFPIKLGEGYLLKSVAPSIWNYVGEELPTGNKEIYLVDGWNFIALPINFAGSYTAKTIAAEINNQGGNITEVRRWNPQSGTWEIWLVNTEYGTNFNIVPGEGYLLLNGVPVMWIPNAVVVSVVCNMSGYAYNPFTQERLVGVKITIDNITTYTISNGTYEILGLRPGTYIVKAEKEGYETASGNVTLVEGNNPIYISMAPR